MIRFIIQFTLIWTSYSFLVAQSTSPSMDHLSDNYSAYREKSITTKRFGIDDLIPLFDQYNKTSELEFFIKTHSLEGRPIYLARYGRGKTPVLFWSQMHGDESTATMALLDLFNYLHSEIPNDQSFLKMIQEKFTLYFIPMLNPDGAALFKRRNAAHIDLNRDAIHLANPESRFLKKMVDSLKPSFGFNLHDQSIYYRAGRDGDQVAMAFLAPASDYDKNINGVRMKSMQLITVLRDSLHVLVPDRIGVYDDSFEPRAFGDNIQRWGTSTILIESGGYPGDPEKQYLRKLNFLTLIKALESIMIRSYETKTIHEYQAIPPNDRKMMSLIIRNLEVPVEGQLIRMDVGYQYRERVMDGITNYPASIIDVGDLSIYRGFEEFQAEGYKAIQGRWYENSFENMGELKKSNWKELVRAGYLGFVVNKISEKEQIYPVQVVSKRPQNGTGALSLSLAPGKSPTFILVKGDKKRILHNGKVYVLEAFLETLKEAFDMDN